MVVVLCSILVSACVPVSPAYSPAAERDLNLLKGRSLRLMALAEEPFADNQKAADKLLADLAEARDRAGARTQNGIATRQWDELLDQDGHLLGGYLQRWETETVLRPGFIVEARRLVEQAMDAMIEHERTKIGGDR